MTKEASWIAVMLAGLVILMALLSPGRAQGTLPALETMERPSTAVYRIPLIGPIFGRLQRQMIVLTWQLEAIPVE